MSTGSAGGPRDDGAEERGANVGGGVKEGGGGGGVWRGIAGGGCECGGVCAYSGRGDDGGGTGGAAFATRRGEGRIADGNSLGRWTSAGSTGISSSHDWKMGFICAKSSLAHVIVTWVTTRRPSSL